MAELRGACIICGSFMAVFFKEYLIQLFFILISWLIFHFN